MTKELYFDDTLESIRYVCKKTLETLPLCLYESIYTGLDESFMTNTVLGFATNKLMPQTCINSKPCTVRELNFMG